MNTRERIGCLLAALAIWILACLAISPWVPAVARGYGLLATLTATCLWIARSRPELGVEWRLGPLRESLRVTGRVLSWSTVALSLFGLALVAAMQLGWTPPSLESRSVSSVEQVRGFLFFGVLLAPPIEEAMHRGVLQPLLRAGGGARSAILLSGPLFWVYHWGAAGGISPPNQLVAGWILAWARERSGGLLAPICLHAAGNLFVLALDLWLMK